MRRGATDRCETHQGRLFPAPAESGEHNFCLHSLPSSAHRDSFHRAGLAGGLDGRPDGPPVVL